jgi:FlaA1/EpsC-like NDP-sugar epimerase
MTSTMITFLLRFRRPVVVAIHLILIGLANYLAFWVRFDGTIPDWAMEVFLQTLPLLVFIRMLIFVPFRLYQGMWQYTSIWDLKNIVASSVLGVAVFYCAVQWGVGLEGYPRSIYILDTVLLIGLLGGARLSRRVYREFKGEDREIRVLIYGAGDAGESLVRALQHNPMRGYEPVGFVDDDVRKKGLSIHGIRVLGGCQDLQRIMTNVTPHVVLLAIPSAKPKTVRELVKLLEPHKVKIQTVPNLRSILEGRVEIAQIRNLAVEDLLDRAPVGLDVAPIRQLIKGKAIMVTGAGGSIGSEICRQVAALDPSNLVLFERYENSLHSILNELRDRKPRLFLSPVVGDVTDQIHVESVLKEFRPTIIFHAAAHKHVPLMEINPCEAVINNVGGTRTLVEAADLYGAEKVIMISTDKAVNPTSVMGATKRVAELFVRGMASLSRTSFMIVRFGNVLGSNGSVVPRFLEQIKAGGPVTVTHPEMRRFFMLIPEAVQLVLYAAALGETGSTYVLEMGEQVKVVDLARNLIRLSGLTPDDDIPITFVGLRPGEKLFEELVGAGETAERSPMEKILQVNSRFHWNYEDLVQLVSTLEWHAGLQENKRVMELLC